MAVSWNKKFQKNIDISEEKEFFTYTLIKVSVPTR